MSMGMWGPFLGGSRHSSVEFKLQGHLYSVDWTVGLVYRAGPGDEARLDQFQQLALSARARAPTTRPAQNRSD